MIPVKWATKLSAAGTENSRRVRGSITSLIRLLSSEMVAKLGQFCERVSHTLVHLHLHTVGHKYTHTPPLPAHRP